jgi:hypothetical protein
MDFIRSVGSLEEAMKISSGEANAERPHVTAPVYYPLEGPVSRETALCGVGSRLRDAVGTGRLQLVAAARGTIGEEGEDDRAPVQFLLLWGTGSPDGSGETPIYWTFEVNRRELDTAVLMDGHGRRYGGPVLPREEAVGLWVAGFLNWNCECPGLYRLHFAYVEG